MTTQKILVGDTWYPVNQVIAVEGDGGGVTDHGLLSGLEDDDHTQYLLADGTRALTGEMDAGNQNITDVNNLYTFNTTAVTIKVDNIEAGLDPPNVEVLAPLSIEVPVTEPLHATTKEYVDAADALYLQLLGGALSGALTLPGDPTDNLHAATKAYVDANSGGVGGTSGIYRVVLGVGGTDSDWTYLGSPITGRPADMPAWGIIQFDTAQHEDVTEPTQFMWDHGEAGDQWMRWQTVLFPTP